MKILITGANGFLGKHIIPLLNNIQIFIPSSSEFDLTNREQIINSSIWKNHPDVILHMAALCGGILANKNSPADFLHKNADMASNIFYAAKEFGCTKIYTLGSVCAYPKFCPVPFKEDNLWNGYPEETNAPYGMAKRFLLMLQQTYREQFGFSGCHLIPVNLYGEYDHFNLTNSHVIPAMIRKFSDAIKNNSKYIECWGTGDATREFLYAGDAAIAIVKAITSNIDYPLPINLGTGKDISIRDLAYLIKKIFKYNGEIIFNKDSSNGQPKRMLDVSRAKEILDWEAITNLENGLIKTINWFTK